jgi:hypothetical protein
LVGELNKLVSLGVNQALDCFAGVISMAWIALGVYTNLLMQLFLLSFGIHALCLLDAILNEPFELFPNLHRTYVAETLME